MSSSSCILFKQLVYCTRTFYLPATEKHFYILLLLNMFLNALNNSFFHSSSLVKFPRFVITSSAHGIELIIFTFNSSSINYTYYLVTYYLNIHFASKYFLPLSSNRTNQQQRSIGQDSQLLHKLCYNHHHTAQKESSCRLMQE